MIIEKLLLLQEAGKCNLENDRDLEGRSPLHIAAWQGNASMVELLIRHGADVNAVDREQRTPLQSAAWQGHESVVWLLLKHGASGDQPCSQGATPLSIGEAHNQSIAVHFYIHICIYVNLCKKVFFINPSRTFLLICSP